MLEGNIHAIKKEKVKQSKEGLNFTHFNPPGEHVPDIQTSPA